MTSLADLHPHPRDPHISLDEATHVYTVCGEAGTYQSVTTFCHHHFPSFDKDKTIALITKGRKYMHDPEYRYYRMSPEAILAQWDALGKEASDKGTKMHYMIECYVNNEPVEDDGSIEFQWFLEFDQAYRSILVPFRTEWRIYHEEWKLSGSIDMVYYHPSDNTYQIYDWKRTKEIEPENAFGEMALTPCLRDRGWHNTSYWIYTLQLNTYRWILQEKYGMAISALCLVRLHPDNVQRSYQRIPLPILDDALRDELMKC